MIEPARRDPPGYLPLVAAGLASVAVLAVVLCVDYLPTHDGPQHVFSSYLNNHLGDPDKGYAAFLRPGEAVTGLGFSILFSSLELALPWRTALGVTLGILVLAWAWGFFFLCRALHPERWPIGLLGFPCALQWALYMGMFSYVASCAVGFHVLALALRRWPWTWKERLFVGVLLTVQAVFHVFGAAVVGLLLGLLVLARARGAERLREIGWLLALSAPTLLIAYLAAGIGAPRANASWAATSIDRLSFADHLRMPAALFFGGPWWRRWPLFGASLGATAIAMARAVRKDARREEIALTGAAVALLLAGVLAPINLPSWDYFSPRFLPVALMVPLALLPIERLASIGARGRHGLGVAGAAFLVANLAWLASYDRDIRARCDDALAGLAAPLHRKGPRLPIVLNPNVGLRATSLSAAMPYAFPLRNVGALYALEQGGVVPDLFANEPRIHEHVFRKDHALGLPSVPDRAYISPLFESEAPDPLEREVILDYMAAFGARYEDVILSGTAADGDQLLRRGFVGDWRRGGVLIARFEGCPSTLRVRAPESIAHPLQLAYGWFPSMVAHWATVAKRREPAASEVSFPLPDAPCGEIWMRVVLDQDESGTLGPADMTCARAAPDGIVLARLSRDTPTVDCELQPAGQR